MLGGGRRLVVRRTNSAYEALLTFGEAPALGGAAYQRSHHSHRVFN